MFKTILYSMFAVFLFALGAMGSWYFFNSQEDPAGEEVAEVDQQDMSANDNPLPQIPEILSALDVPMGVEPEEKPLPTVQPTKPLTAEEIYRFGLINRNRTEKLQQRENMLEERTRQLQLEFKDLEARQAEVDGLLEHIKDTINAGESLISQINQKRLELADLKNQLNEQEESIKSKTGLSPEDQEANDKKTAGLIQSMKPANAAAVIKTLANDGQLDAAIALIEQMEQRTAAKILESIDDQQLQTDIASYLRARKKMQVSAAPNQKR